MTVQLANCRSCAGLLRMSRDLQTVSLRPSHTSLRGGCALRVLSVDLTKDLIDVSNAVSVGVEVVGMICDADVADRKKRESSERLMKSVLAIDVVLVGTPLLFEILLFCSKQPMALFEGT